MFAATWLGVRVPLSIAFTCTPNPIGSVTDRYGQPVAVNQLPCEQVIPQAQADSMLNGMSHDTSGGGTGAAREPAAAGT